MPGSTNINFEKITRSPHPHTHTRTLSHTQTLTQAHTRTLPRTHTLEYLNRHKSLAPTQPHYHKFAHTQKSPQNKVQGGEDPQDALSCRSFSAKEPLIVGLFCVKWPMKIRHPMNLHHPKHTNPNPSLSRRTQTSEIVYTQNSPQNKAGRTCLDIYAPSGKERER